VLVELSQFEELIISPKIQLFERYEKVGEKGGRERENIREVEYSHSWKDESGV
jgi:hypothetical protein